MTENYTVLHLHSDISLLDSCTNYKDYIDMAVVYGMSSICFTEHGSIGLWVEKKIYCEKNNIKYLHGIEVYLTENIEPKIRDNYHTVLIAKNYEGFREINSLIELSSREDHKYYKDRITFDEFLSLSDNIIKVSACLQSPLHKLDESNPYYEKLLKHYDYYEIQPHITKSKIQEDYNKKLYEYSLKYNKPLIATNDIHYSNQYKGECRSILQIAKGIEFADEDTFDLSFHNYNEFKQLFLDQDCLPEDVVMQAITNTNMLAESVESFKLDLSPKYLKLYEYDEKVYMKKIHDMFMDKVKSGLITMTPDYVNQLKEEVRVLKKLNMMGFMLFMSELICWCWENGIPTGTCRGSVGGSLVAYVTDIIDVNPIKWKTVFSRFANEDRVELGDIDVDFPPDQRDMVYEYIINRVTEANSAYISTVGTIAQRGAIDEIGRALHRKWIKENPTKNEDKSPYSLQILEHIKNEFENNPEKTRDAYPEIFYYYDGLLGTAISKGVHPAGIVAANIPLSNEYGIYWYEGKRVLSLNMEEVHEVSLIKYDILSLNNIQIIRDTCKLAGIPYPKSHEINWEDKAVWEDMVSSPAGLFQFSGDYAFDCLKKFSPTIINDMSLVNAALRPSGATYREDLFAGEPHQNPSKLIDNLLSENRGYLVFQEDTIKFLKDICGLSGSEADNIRRAIGRKQKDRLMDAMPRILEGYCSKSDSPREVAEEEAKQFLQIIEDSSNYQFGYNHSVGYSMIGYMCAYLRYYYPVEFTTSFLNNVETKEDIKNGMALAKIKDIKIENILYGHSIDKYTFDKKTKTIYKGISSIKFCNSTMAIQLKETYDNNNFKTFIEVLDHITKNSIANSRQIKILIILGYFRQYGKNQYLLDVYELYQKLGGVIVLAKSKIETLKCFGLNEDLVRKYSKKETEKQFRDIDLDSLMKICLNKIEDKSLSVKLQMEYEMEYLGYVAYQNTDVPNDVYFVTDFKTYNNKSTPYLILYRINDGEIIKTKVTKGSMYEEQPFKLNNILMNVVFREQNKKKYINGRCIISDETEKIINNYTVLG